MKYIRYFIEFLIIKIFFFIFKLLGYRKASNFGSLLGKKIGPFLKSKKIIEKNIKNYSPDIDDKSLRKISDDMWGNYGRIFAEYMFIKNFRLNKINNNIKINGLNYLDEIKNKDIPAIFISAHFSNFELMAMEIEKQGIKLGAVYRPLNNFFLNSTMVKLRKNYICKFQIKKGLSGTREIIKLLKNNFSIAMMIDQRVTEGIASNFFNKPAYTTTIPAQLVKKFGCPIVSVYIERKNNFDFEITFSKPIYFSKNDEMEKITQNLNFWLEKMIIKNPGQWIWTHNRWKL